MLTALVAVTAPVPAEAAVGSDFNAGSIISDAQFYSSNAMSVGAVESFLQQRLPSCRSGYVCLKDYRQTTIAKPADRYCAGFGVNNFSAAEIIEGVSRSCGVSAKVLLVLLEKEQGLVSDSWPTARQYRSATGYGCPDTADCDAQFYGFFNQVYHAARQFQYYRATPTNWRYQAGRSNFIQYNPRTECGGSGVYIQNQATAGLYIYTPYQPNTSALNNLYGAGDNCGAYGNRNFWRMYTDWFGSTNTFPVTGGIGDYYVTRGGATGTGLGAPTGPQVVIDRARFGWSQTFENGRIHWSPATGAVKTSGGIGVEYERLGGPTGSGLGYPIEDQVQLNDSAQGWMQRFESGRIYWSPATGAFAVTGGIGQTFVGAGANVSAFGYPVSSYSLIPGGGAQSFQAGRLYWSPGTGVVFVDNEMSAVLDSLNGVDGSTLGFPVSAFGAETTGAQRFQNGWLTKANGGWRVQGGIAQGFLDAGIRARVGLPTGDQRPVDSGWRQPFENGDIYWTGRFGSQPVAGDFRAAYDRLGGPSGSGLGFPSGGSAESSGTRTQTFQYGSLVSVNGGAVERRFDDPVRASRFSDGGVLPSLGALQGGRQTVGSGWVESYQNGQVYGSPATPAVRVSGGIGAAYQQAGGPTGALGFPIAESAPLGDEVGGWSQRFANGTVYWAPGVGGTAVPADIARAYEAFGGPRAALSVGYPAAPVESVAGGVIQRFSGGVGVGAGSGVRFIKGGIAADWMARGGLASYLGAPVGIQSPDASGGWSQRFVNGVVYWSPATGVVPVSGGIGSAYVQRGGPSGTYLGYPTAVAFAVSGGWVQYFQNGRLYWSETTGVIMTGGGIGALYHSTGGSTGYLGLPLTAQFALGDGGWTQQFQNGRIYWAPGVGANRVSGGIGWAYENAGGAQGSGLGYPTGEQIEVSPGRWVQIFASGRITWTQATGARFS